MSPWRDHLHIIPEDDANRQIVQGFLVHDAVNQPQCKVRSPAGGWRKVLDVFTEEYVPLLQRHEHAHVLLVIDFDGDYAARRAQCNAMIPPQYADRVFVLGPSDNPETLCSSLRRKKEELGTALAEECLQQRASLWHDPQMIHNDPDRLRLMQSVWQLLFQPHEG